MSAEETLVDNGVSGACEFQDHNPQNDVEGDNQIQSSSCENEDTKQQIENVDSSVLSVQQPASSNTDVNDALATDQEAGEMQQSESITNTTMATTPVTISNLNQLSNLTSDQGEITQITGLPPGVSLIQADQGQDGEGAIFLLVTGPVDGEEGTANAIAVDAATAAAMASLQTPIEVASSGQSISIEGLATAVSNSAGKNGNDPVAEILSSLTGERVIVSADESAVVQVAATAEAQAAGSSKTYPSPSEVSLAQDILALASSALSSSASAQKVNEKETLENQNDVKMEQAEEYRTSEEGDGKPNWATLLQDFQKIGQSFHGYVMNEVEMDQVLNSYKKETNSLFAIRQTPSPVKEENGTVRLMWKSQHVPYDGVPFINIGRRATVMECEHGPRKKTNALKRMFNSPTVDKASLKSVVNLTCPARVFIKKVRKFPEFKVASTTDPKILRSHQEQSLKQLRELGMNTWTGGEVRLYMQLPDAESHRYHMIGSRMTDQLDSSNSGDYRTDISPRVVGKIKESVRQGVCSPFVVRQIARHYVEKEMVTTGEEKIPKHDKSFYPTMIEIQNLTQQIQADLLAGVLSPLPMPADGLPQSKPKKRRTSVKAFGEPISKKPTSNGDYTSSDVKKEESENVDAGADGTTIGTFSLTLPEGQLENFSIANLNMEQLQQLAKIGLLALNNATTGKSNIPMTTATVNESGTIEIEASVSQAESTSTVDTSEQIPNEAVVLLTSSVHDQVTSSEAEEAVQAIGSANQIESTEMATSTLDEAPASSSAQQDDIPNMVVSAAAVESGDAQPSTTTSDDNPTEDSVVSSVEATTTTGNAENCMMDNDEQ